MLVLEDENTRNTLAGNIVLQNFEYMHQAKDRNLCTEKNSRARARARVCVCVCVCVCVWGVSLDK